MSSGCAWVGGGLLGVAGGQRAAEISFGAWRRTWSGCSCPGFSDRLWASGGQTNGGACRDRIGGAWAALGLNGSLAGEDVPGGDQDLARDGGLGGVGLAVAALDVGVERGARGCVGRQACWAGLDGGPAQRGRAGLGEPAGARALAGLLDPRGQAGVADELARGREARDVADLGGEREPEQLGDAGDASSAAWRVRRGGRAAAARARAARAGGRGHR